MRCKRYDIRRHCLVTSTGVVHSLQLSLTLYERVDLGAHFRRLGLQIGAPILQVPNPRGELLRHLYIFLYSTSVFICVIDSTKVMSCKCVVQFESYLSATGGHTIAHIVPQTLTLGHQSLGRQTLQLTLAQSGYFHFIHQLIRLITVRSIFIKITTVGC